MPELLLGALGADAFGAADAALAGGLAGGAAGIGDIGLAAALPGVAAATPDFIGAAGAADAAAAAEAGGLAGGAAGLSGADLAALGAVAPDVTAGAFGGAAADFGAVPLSAADAAFPAGAVPAAATEGAVAPAGFGAEAATEGAGFGSAAASLPATASAANLADLSAAALPSAADPFAGTAFAGSLTDPFGASLGQIGNLANPAGAGLGSSPFTDIVSVPTGPAALEQPAIGDFAPNIDVTQIPQTGVQFPPTTEADIVNPTATLQQTIPQSVSQVATTVPQDITDVVPQISQQEALNTNFGATNTIGSTGPQNLVQVGQQGALNTGLPDVGQLSPTPVDTTTVSTGGPGLADAMTETPTVDETVTPAPNVSAGGSVPTTTFTPTTPSGGITGAFQNMLTSNPMMAASLGLGALGLGAAVWRNLQALPEQKQLQALAAQLASNAAAQQQQAQALINPLITGQLPPNLAAQVIQAQQDATTQIRSRYAAMGQAGSTAEINDIAASVQAAAVTSGQLEQQLATAGIQLTTAATQGLNVESTIFQALMNAQINANDALAQAIASFAGQSAIAGALANRKAA